MRTWVPRTLKRTWAASRYHNFAEVVVPQYADFLMEQETVTS